ncbi:hypothetical protein CcCBS67573_g05928 [Chytriomyces confervae]|uniref:J domain-containing protein n=1 Tax=Chytriomyces confervae TaxID=246404 RepID=A0A507F9W1_9FUNG|nr:hypothetical protein HDU80_006643 [Chytriomyces hyalinus]TPX72068.1 hypothetical protein CcCBS67573_g05928 [Chytriomyces confervae]
MISSTPKHIARRCQALTLPALQLYRPYSPTPASARPPPPISNCWNCGKSLCTPTPTCAKMPMLRQDTGSNSSTIKKPEPLPSSLLIDVDGCGAVQPVSLWTSFFDVFAISPPSFDVDLGALKQRYLRMQQIVHPDANSQRSEKERDFSETQSVFINKAYQALRDPLARAKYMLHLKDIHIDEADKGSISPQSLMEIMEIWEEIEGLESQEGLDALTHENEKRIADEVRTLSKAFQKEDLALAKDAVVKLQYWYSLKQRLRDVHF